VKQLTERMKLMERFNWQGLIAAVLASAGASLLISLADGRLDLIELARAAVQAVIAAAAFVERPHLRGRRGGGGRARG